MAMFADKAQETRNPKMSLLDEINGIFEQSNKDKENNVFKKILISGPSGVGKTSLSLSLLTKDLKDDEVIVFVNVDNSGPEIIYNFFEKEYFNNQIILIDAQRNTLTKEGASVLDAEETVLYVSTIAQAIRNYIEQGLKIKGVIVDGVSFLLDYAEAKMRLDKNMDAAQGAPSMGIWKIRNEFFRKFTSAFMSLSIPVIFISHDDFMPENVEPGKDLSGVKQRLIDECSMRIILEQKQDPQNEFVTNYVATVKKNRSDIFSINQEVVFRTVNVKEKTLVASEDNLYNLIYKKPTNNKKRSKK